MRPTAHGLKTLKWKKPVPHKYRNKNKKTCAFGWTDRQTKRRGKKEVHFPNIDGTFLPDSIKNKEESDFIDQDIFKFRKLIFKVKKKKNNSIVMTGEVPMCTLLKTMVLFLFFPPSASKTGIKDPCSIYSREMPGKEHVCLN